MKKYYLVIVANNIHLERGIDLPITGFVAPRCVRGKNETDATHFAKIQLLKDWKITFNRNNKAGTPQLSVAQSKQIKNPFKRLQLSDDYLFFGTEDEKTHATDKAIAAFKRWFVIR